MSSQGRSTCDLNTSTRTTMKNKFLIKLQENSMKWGSGLFCITALSMISGCNTEIPENPNILIAMGDDISFPHMSAYGCKWVKTPGFDMVARQGILFRNAYTPNAKSSPSRSCLLTGRNSWQLEEVSLSCQLQTKPMAGWKSRNRLP